MVDKQHEGDERVNHIPKFDELGESMKNQVYKTFFRDVVLNELMQPQKNSGFLNDVAAFKPAKIVDEEGAVEELRRAEQNELLNQAKPSRYGMFANSSGENKIPKNDNINDDQATQTKTPKIGNEGSKS